MTVRLQIILLFILVVGMGIIINMVRKRILDIKYVLTWMLADIVLIVLILLPGLIKVITRLLGIRSSMNMIFFMGFLLSVGIMFSLTVALSKATANMRRMSQTIAILKKELKELEKKNQEPD